MDVCIISQQALLMRMPEIGSMIYSGLLGGRAPKDFRSPGVEVGIEVDYADGTVGFVHRAEEGQCDCVVAAECYEAGECFLFKGGADFCCVCHGGTHEEGVVTFFDLLYGVCIVVSVRLSVLLNVCGMRGTYEVTGISPQSRTVAQLLKGLASRGTL